MVVDHDTRLHAARDAVNAARSRLDAALDARDAAAAAAVADGVTRAHVATRLGVGRRMVGRIVDGRRSSGPRS